MKRQDSFIFVLVGFLAINSPGLQAEEERGTFAAPKISDVRVYGNERVTSRRVVFSYTDGANEVVGTTTGVHFTLDRPVKDVWPIFQDFNLWQNHQGLSHTGVYGDKEGDLEFLIYNVRPRGEASLSNTMAFRVEQLVPEQLIVLHSPLWEGVDADGNRLGFRHEGKNAFMLTEVNGKTVVTAAMEHANHYYGPDAKNEAAAGLQQKLAVAQARKKDIWEAFVSKLGELVEGHK